MLERRAGRGRQRADPVIQAARDDARSERRGGDARRARSSSLPTRSRRSGRRTTPPRSSGTRTRTSRRRSPPGRATCSSELGIEVVAETSADFDAAKQKADIETVEAKKPSVLLTLPVDPVDRRRRRSRRWPAQGTKIVLLSSRAAGHEARPRLRQRRDRRPVRDGAARGRRAGRRGRGRAAGSRTSSATPTPTSRTSATRRS